MENRWGNNKNSERLYFGRLKNLCRWWLQHEIKRCLLLWRKVLTNLDSILKSRDISLLTNVHLVKCMVFLVVMYGCEISTIKKSECLKNWCFCLCCWRRLRIPWTAMRFNQSILKEIVLNINWNNWCWSWNSNTLMLGKIEDGRRTRWQRMR